MKEKMKEERLKLKKEKRNHKQRERRRLNKTSKWENVGVRIKSDNPFFSKIRTTTAPKRWSIDLMSEKDYSSQAHDVWPGQDSISQSLSPARDLRWATKKKTITISPSLPLSLSLPHRTCDSWASPSYTLTGPHNKRRSVSLSPASAVVLAAKSSKERERNKI